MSIVDVANTVQEQILEAVRAGQDMVVSSVSNWSGAVVGVLPEQPRGRLAEGLPRAVALVDNAFGFAEKLLDAQRQFAHRLVEAYTPKAEAA
ncbi:MAG TPA: hypothetical protein VE990_17200 [Acidimicrobiales bacterium]|nr:hypothetical protein [Acidimicrobiales bacterium]